MKDQEPLYPFRRWSPLVDPDQLQFMTTGASLIAQDDRSPRVAFTCRDAAGLPVKRGVLTHHT